MPADDFEQGYWVDVDSAVRTGQSGLTIEALHQSLPDDIRNGLNWSANKQFFFILSVLAPLPAAPELPVEPAADIFESSEENSNESNPIGLGELFNMFPGALDKEGAALIQARNSAVAAWRWRKYAADTQLATNQIRIDPWCGVMGIKTDNDQQNETA